MRSVIQLFLAVFLSVLVGLPSAAWAAEQHTTLTVKADGSCVVTTDNTEPRMVTEQQVRMWERYQKTRDSVDDEAKPQTAAGEARPFTDEELGKKLRETFQVRAEQAGEDSPEKIEMLEIKTNTVRTVTTRNFASLEEMLKQALSVWGQVGISFENVKFEKDAGEHLRVTLTPAASAQRFTKTLRQQWKLTGAVNEMKLIFPGNVLTSGLPQTEGNATWLVIDAQKTETMDAAMKLYDAPTIITAELGGLKLDQPLESKTLQRMARRGSGPPDLPITDAGPGFLAEPIAVTTTTLYYFPGGEKYLHRGGRLRSAEARPARSCGRSFSHPRDAPCNPLAACASSRPPTTKAGPSAAGLGKATPARRLSSRAAARSRETPRPSRSNCNCPSLTRRASMSCPPRPSH